MLFNKLLSLKYIILKNLMNTKRSKLEREEFFLDKTKKQNHDLAGKQI